jgi:glycosyltransferase involved in cell wall biosynthesis
MAPKVSVLIPCFNLGRFLDETVASVEAQTVPEWEMLIVDDGSTEPETIRKLATFAHPKARVFHTENRGLPAARNFAAARAEGEYLCALDADDLLAPTWFEKALTAFAVDSELAFVSHWLETFGDQQGTWKPERCDFPALLDVNTVNGAALVRREVWAAIGGWDETLRQGCEDWDFWITAVERGYRGTIVPEVLFRYRRHAGSMSREFLMETHLGIYTHLVAKHATTYREHLLPLALRREGDLVDVLRETSLLELDQVAALGPRLVDRRAERAALQESRAEAVLVQTRLVAERQALQAEVAALRDSWSWRLTAPLRALARPFFERSGRG